MRRFLFFAIAVCVLSVVYCGCQEVTGESAFGPVITSADPSSGPPDTRVTLTGTGFGPMVGTVKFVDVKKGKQEAAIFDWSDTQIKVAVPAMPSGVQTAVISLESSVAVPSSINVEFHVTKP